MVWKFANTLAPRAVQWAWKPSHFNTLTLDHADVFDCPSKIRLKVTSGAIYIESGRYNISWKENHLKLYRKPEVTR